MMKKLSLFLALIMVLTLGAGFASADAAELEPYEIVWYTLGTPAEGDALVIEEINKYLTQNFNATLKMIANGNAEHLEKLNLMVNAQQEFDICFISQDYASYVAREAFYPLTDLLNEYGKDMLAQYPQNLWDSVTINNEIYAIPVHKYSCSHYYYMFNADVASKANVDLSWINAGGTKLDK